MFRKYSLMRNLLLIWCFVNWFKIRIFHLTQNIHLTYASSSSVYGKNSPIPFHLNADTDHPGNMYAATKRANELMAYQHCTSTGIKSVGLRFFTVYGPWGRPDMAVYKFAQSIVEGKKVPMFKVRYWV